MGSVLGFQSLKGADGRSDPSFLGSRVLCLKFQSLKGADGRSDGWVALLLVGAILGFNPSKEPTAVLTTTMLVSMDPGKSFNPSKEPTAVLTQRFNCFLCDADAFQSLKGADGRSDQEQEQEEEPEEVFQSLKGADGRSDIRLTQQTFVQFMFQSLKGADGRSDTMDAT